MSTANDASNEVADPMTIRRYRADIDGLRAIAVLLVLAFHLEISVVPGGFAGVDIFFVISGYLITQIIISELRSGRFSILRFYERRVRRIFPALFAMMAVSVVCAWILLLPIDFKNFGQSVAAATLFASNILFIFESGYFDADAELKPLLHTWSLAVEEQFYILFPLALAWIWAWRRQWLMPVFAAIACLSFFAAIQMVATDPAKAFFLSPTRFWELLLGALLAAGSWPSLAPSVLLAAGWFGAAAIAYSAVFFSPEASFPAWAALWPCSGAALIIFSGQYQASSWSINRILASRPMVAIGLISYSLYLWHWPVIVFYRYVSIEAFSGPEQALLAILSLVLAYLSWRFVEMPFRRGQIFRYRPALALSACAVMGTATILGAGISIKQGMPWRIDQDIVRIEKDQLYVRYQDDCRYEIKDSFSVCIRGDETALPRFLLLGDSHAGSVSAGVFAAAQDEGLAGVQLTVPGYRPFLGFGRKGKERWEHQVDEQVEHVLSSYPGIRMVIIVAHWRQALDAGYVGPGGISMDRDHLLETGLQGLLQRYPERQFVLMGGYPIDETFGANRLARERLFGHQPTMGISRRAHIEATRTTLAQLEAVSKEPNVTLASLDDLFCDKEFCWSVDGGRSLYRDTDHLSLPGAMRTRTFFRTILGALTSQESQTD